MTSALLDELKLLAPEVELSMIEDKVGAFWVSLAAVKDPQERRIGAVLVEVGLK